MSHVSLVDIEIIQCSQCGNEDPIIPHLNELMTLLAAAVVKKPCALNGEEVRFLRKFLKMTGEQFAKYLGVTKSHVSKWENDADKVGAQSDRLIRALTVCLGEDLRKYVEETGRLFADIEEVGRIIDYKIDPEAEQVQYV